MLTALPHLARLPGMPRQAPAPRPQRGVAALTVVMVLFFVMALVAAYTNRNLIFEQRISLANYRVARAVTAADGSLNWAIGLLNAGRINSACRPSTDLADVDWRRMAMDVPGPQYAAPEGSYALPWDFNSLSVRVWGCVMANGQMSCACPTTSTPNPTITPPDDGRGTAFHVSLYIPEQARPIPGMLGVLGFACGSLGTGASNCARSSSYAGRPQVDGIGGASEVVGLLRALPLGPPAALVVGGAVNAAAGTLLVVNPDATSGYTVFSGGAYTAGTGDRFVRPAGTAGEGRIHGIGGLSALAALPNDGWFRNLFAMDKPSYAIQPAARVIDCSGGCTDADVLPVLRGYPRSPIVLNGSLNIANAATLGNADPTVDEPAMLVIHGALTISGNATIYGYLHAESVTWSATTATVRGAMMTPGNFTVTGTARLAFDKAAVDMVKYRYGSFVRAPGTWNLRENYR